MWAGASTRWPKELGCDWHTVNDAVVAYGAALVDHPDRFGDSRGPRARRGAVRPTGPLSAPALLHLDRRRRPRPAARRGARPSRAEPEGVARQQGQGVVRQVSLRHLDLSGAYRAVFDVHDARCHPGGRSVSCGEARQRQAGRVPPPGPERDTRPPGPKDRSPLSVPEAAHDGRRAPREQRPRRSSSGLLRAGDPNGEVATAWHAKEAVRELYAHDDPSLALEWVDQLGSDLTWPTGLPLEAPLPRPHPRAVEAPDRGLAHRSRLERPDRGDQQPDQAGEARRVRLHATSRNYRVRALLYAGKPDWSLLRTVRPTMR